MRTFDSLIIHHGSATTRFLTGATVQYWDGTTWITHSTFSNLTQQCVNRVGIGVLAAQRFRITAFIPGTGQTSNQNFREIEILEASTASNDAGVARIDSPLVVCTPSANVVATIQNFGTNIIDSVDVNWSVNGVAQTPFQYIGTLDTVNGTGVTTAQVTLGSFAFGAGLNEIKVWTSNPNGTADTANFNDTLVRFAGQGMSGAYTINSGAATGGTNFQTFTDFANTLGALGMCGPVTATVSAGVYNESVVFDAIQGNSSTNTITIDGLDSSAAIIISPNYSTFAVTNVTHFTIRNLGIRNTNIGGSISMLVGNGSDNVTIENCEIKASLLSTNFGLTALATSASLTGRTTGALVNNVMVSNNRVVGGYYGVYFYGSNTTYLDNCDFMGNDIDSAYVYGLWSYYSNNSEIIGNNINTTTRGATFADGLYLGYNPNVVVEGNYVYSPDWSFYLFNSISTLPALTKKNRIVNNMFISDTDFAMRLFGTDSVDIWHNSFYSATTSTFSATVEIENSTFTNVVVDDYDMRNNILFGQNGIALTLDGNSISDTIFSKFDNNIYNTATGTNLFDIDGTFYTDLTSYQTAQPLYNGNSLEGDPLFISTTDLHLTGGLADQAADTSVGVTIDIDGDPRPSPGATITDIGADEYLPPTCVPLLNASAFPFSSDSVELTWDGTLSQDYQWEVVNFGAAQGTGIGGFTTSDSIRVGTFLPATTYDFYVRQICSRGDTSLWVGPVSFTTLCSPLFPMPYRESFDITGTQPPCITIGSTSGGPWSFNPTFHNTVTCSGAFDHTGNGGTWAGVDMSGTDNGVWLQLPDIDVTGKVPGLSFWFWMCDQGYTPPNPLFVEAWDGSAWIVYDSVVGNGAQWTNYTTNLGGAAFNDTLRVRFRAESGGAGADFYGDHALDDIVIDTLSGFDLGVTAIVNPTTPICPGTTQPVVTVSNLGADTATSTTVVWDINGVLDSLVFPIVLAPGADTNLTLGNVTFSNGVFYNVAIYTNNVNGLGIDGDPTNDTLSVNGLRTGLNGAFTIDSTSAASATNFQSFEDFGADISAYGICGAVTVDVVSGSGPYDNQLLLENVNGSASTPIVINGNGETIRFGSNDANQRAVITVASSSYITFDSLNVEGLSTSVYAWGYQITDVSSHIDILNSTVEVPATSGSSTIQNGIVVNGSATSIFTGSDNSNIRIENNTVIGGYAGIWIQGNFGTPQPNFVVRNNVVQDFDDYGIAFRYADTSDISLNDIERGVTRTLGFTMYGIYLLSVNNATIDRNQIHNTHGSISSKTGAAYPFFFTGDAASGSPVFVTNNIVYDVNSNGTIYAVYDNGYDNMRFLNNTISLDDSSSTGGVVRGVFYPSNFGLTSSIYENNIISINRTGSGDKTGLWYSNFGGTGVTGPTVSDNNNVYINSTGGTNNYGSYGAAFVDLNAWQTGTTYDANSHEVDPRYNTPDSLVPSNALINAQASVSPNVTTDYYGVARTSNPDIGAVEFDPPPFDDMAVDELVAPFADVDSCYGAAQNVVIKLLNSGGNVIDFTNTPLTLTVDVTGATTATLTQTINTNAINGAPLAIGDDIEVNVGTINMTNAGQYDFLSTLSMTTDSLSFNDTLISNVTIQAPFVDSLIGADTICAGDTAYLSVSGYNGELQWQELVSGVWVDIIGANSGRFKALPTALTSYRAVACGTQVSDTISVFPFTVPAPTAVNGFDTVACGDSAIVFGSVSSADTSATFAWYLNQFGGSPIDSIGNLQVTAGGDSIRFNGVTSSISTASDTVWVEVAAKGGTTLLITEVFNGNPDYIEIQNPTNTAIDVSGWTVWCSNVGINTVSTQSQTLSGVMLPNATMSWDDITWGANLPWVAASEFWVMITDAQGAVVDFVAVNASAATLSTMSVTLGGNVYSDPIANGWWIGNGVPGTNNYEVRQGASDNNDATDWTSPVVGTRDSSNTQMTYPFASPTCPSARIPVFLEVFCAVGVEDADNSVVEAITVSPNPSNGLFTVNISTKEIVDYNMTIRDITGQLILDEIININGDFRRDFDLSNLAKGVYFLRLQSETESHVEKIVIQ